MPTHSNLPFGGQEVTPVTADAQGAKVHHKHIHPSASGHENSKKHINDCMQLKRREGWGRYDIRTVERRVAVREERSRGRGRGQGREEQGGEKQGAGRGGAGRGEAGGKEGRSRVKGQGGGRGGAEGRGRIRRS